MTKYLSRPKMQIKIEKLQEEIQALELQKDVLEKVFHKYQQLMACIDKSISNWQIIEKQFEEMCQKHKIDLLLGEFELDLPNVPEGVTLTYRQIQTAIITLQAIKKGV